MTEELKLESPDTPALPDLDTKTVSELKKLAAEKSLGSGVWRQGASKAALIAALQTGVIADLPAPVIKAGNGNSGDLAAVLADAIQGHLKLSGVVDMEAVDSRIEERLKTFEMPVKRIVIDNPQTGETKDVGVQHKTFEILLKLCACKKPDGHRYNFYLVGPAGSGKSQAVRAVAEALDLPFACQSFCLQSSKADLLGYMNAHGTYVRTLFRDIYENGGVFLCDEIDNANENVTVVLNDGTSNGEMAFPDGMVKRHADCVIIAAANTWGNGADRQYVGRRQLDAAFLNRFKFIIWDYDESFEKALAGNDEWVAYVLKIRHSVFKNKIRHVVSPRASIDGAQLLAQGIERKTVEEITLWQGLDEPTRQKIRDNMES